MVGPGEDLLLGGGSAGLPVWLCYAPEALFSLHHTTMLWFITITIPSFPTLVPQGVHLLAPGILILSWSMLNKNSFPLNSIKNQPFFSFM